MIGLTSSTYDSRKQLFAYRLPTVKAGGGVEKVSG
jgi:hypothetical protein